MLLVGFVVVAVGCWVRAFSASRRVLLFGCSDGMTVVLFDCLGDCCVGGGDIIIIPGGGVIPGISTMGCTPGGGVMPGKSIIPGGGFENGCALLIPNGCIGGVICC